MTKVRAEVWFRGKTTIEVEPDDYPWYSELTGKTLDDLLMDSFYDEADLRGIPFVDDSTEFFDAEIEVID